MSCRIFDDNQVGREARNAIRGQRHRCNNKKASDYKYYGGKGIKVEYSSIDFFNWFKKQRKKIPLNIKVNVDRLDHDKNYSLDNVRLIPKTSNVSESNTRRSKLTAKIIISEMKNGLSQKDIAKKYKVTQSAVSNYCKRNHLKWEKDYL